MERVTDSNASLMSTCNIHVSILLTCIQEDELSHCYHNEGITINIVSWSL